jgi:hypothetical protein
MTRRSPRARVAEKKVVNGGSTDRPSSFDSSFREHTRAADLVPAPPAYRRRLRSPASGCDYAGQLSVLQTVRSKYTPATARPDKRISR